MESLSNYFHWISPTYFLTHNFHILLGSIIKGCDSLQNELFPTITSVKQSNKTLTEDVKRKILSNLSPIIGGKIISSNSVAQWITLEGVDEADGYQFGIWYTARKLFAREG